MSGLWAEVSHRTANAAQELHTEGTQMTNGRSCRALLGSLGMLILATGCQVDVGGQTLPSPYYLQDDVQYFAPGPEFKLAREAAAQKAAREEEILREE